MGFILYYWQLLQDCKNVPSDAASCSVHMSCNLKDALIFTIWNFEKPLIIYIILLIICKNKTMWIKVAVIIRNEEEFKNWKG